MSYPEREKILNERLRAKKAAGDQLDKLAKQLAARDGLSYIEAFDRVAGANPDLYSQYLGRDQAA